MISDATVGNLFFLLFVVLFRHKNKTIAVNARTTEPTDNPMIMAVMENFSSELVGAVLDAAALATSLTIFLFAFPLIV